MYTLTSRGHAGHERTIPLVVDPGHGGLHLCYKNRLPLVVDPGHGGLHLCYKNRLPLVISTPAPSTKVNALGFSTATVICGIGNSARHVLTIKAASASIVWKLDASTT